MLRVIRSQIKLNNVISSKFATDAQIQLSNLVKNIDKQQQDLLQQKNLIDNLNKSFVFEQQRQNDLKQIDAQFQIASISSNQPLRDTLITFELHNKKGFDEDLVGKTFEALGKTYLSLGEQPRVYQDLTKTELFDNWRFTDLLGDLKYGLNQDFSYENIQKVNLKIPVRVHELQFEQMNYSKNSFQQLFFNSILV